MSSNFAKSILGDPKANELNVNEIKNNGDHNLVTMFKHNKSLKMQTFLLLLLLGFLMK